MSKYLFVYHGGSMPESDEEAAKVMQAWMDWLKSMGDDAVDPGNPVGMSATVHPDKSVTNDGGSNPVSGYGIISATDLDDAYDKAKGCPILDAGGTVEVAQIHEIPM